jgi:Xaa-Pro aminopeptidase
MFLHIDRIQAALDEDRLDGWLLYDFHGSNPIAQRLAGLEGRHTTRRWYYFIPVTGQPRKLVHAIESATLDGLPGDRHTYAGRHQLEAGLEALLRGARHIAMEYSPRCAIPYVSRVDAGTIEVVRGLGLTIASSGDLVGRFEAAWDEAAIATHRGASEALYRIKDNTFAYIGERMASGQAVRELDVQARMLQWFGEEGLVTDAPPIVAVEEHSGDPHYSPDAQTSRLVAQGDVVLLDLWGKFEQSGAVYADITWTGVVGEPAAEVDRVFRVVAAGRDAALDRVRRAVASGEPIHGWEVDRAARDVIGDAGYGERFVHRTGHSLGVNVHGNGVHMDDFETHDDRRLLVGTGFTIEPGVYTDRFGIRSEINVVVGRNAAEATGPLQRALVRIDGRR